MTLDNVIWLLGIQGRNLIVPADKSKWSESSKNSYSYESCIEGYADISYKCYKCGNCAVFTAQDQKEAFEVRKCYVWQRRNLCAACYDEFSALKTAIKNYEKLWASESDLSKSTAPYIRDWFLALNMVPSFGKRANQAMITHLKKYLDNNA